jgi:hypothetical protein
MDFPCTGCGECCKRVQSVLEGSWDHPVLRELVERFPYQTRRDGSCEMYGADGRCQVYDSRPLICNIKLGGMMLGLDQQKWYEMNMVGCNQMIEDAGLDPSFLVSLEK